MSESVLINATIYSSRQTPALADWARGLIKKSITLLVDIIATSGRKRWKGEITASPMNVKSFFCGVRIERYNRVSTEDMGFCVYAKVDSNLREKPMVYYDLDL